MNVNISMSYKIFSTTCNGSAHFAGLFAPASLYTRGNPFFNKTYEPYSDEYIKKRFIYDDRDGKGPYRAQGKGQKQYLSDSKGIPLSDVWAIPIENVMSANQTGYPTQKPEALLQRLISSSSREGLSLIHI